MTSRELLAGAASPCCQRDVFQFAPAVDTPSLPIELLQHGPLHGGEVSDGPVTLDAPQIHVQHDAGAQVDHPVGPPPALHHVQARQHLRA